MKRLSSFLICLLVIEYCLPASCTLTFGQSDGYYSKAGDKGRGYWNLKTDYASRGTQIRFYSADSQLIYQESLPNQFIKLTPANIRRLDQTLARLVENQLVASSIETSDIPYEWPVTKPVTADESAKKGNSVPAENLAKSSLFVRFHPTPEKPGVNLFMHNPSLERVTIKILSAENAIMYEQNIRSVVHRYFLNMTGMPAGIYKVLVRSSTKQIQQLLTVSYGSNATIVQLTDQNLQTAPEQLITHK